MTPSNEDLTIIPFRTGNLEILTDPEIVHTFQDLANTLSAEIITTYQSDPLSDRGAAAVIASIALSVVDDNSYHVADRIIFDIRTARKALGALLEQHADPIIKPIRAGLDKLYAMRRDVAANLDKPLEDAERNVKIRMARYQEDKRKEAQAEEDRRRQEAVRIDREAAAAKLTAMTSSNVQEVHQALQQVSSLQQQAAVIRHAPPPPPPVKGMASKTVVTKKWVVKDLTALIKAVAAGKVPEMVLAVDEEVMDAYWAEDRISMMGWDGVGVEEVTTVTGR